MSRGKQGGNVGAQVAVELLWRLQHLGLADSNQAVKVCSKHRLIINATIGSCEAYGVLF